MTPSLIDVIAEAINASTNRQLNEAPEHVQMDWVPHTRLLSEDIVKAIDQEGYVVVSRKDAIWLQTAMECSGLQYSDESRYDSVAENLAAALQSPEAERGGGLSKSTEIDTQGEASHHIAQSDKMMGDETASHTVPPAQSDEPVAWRWPSPELTGGGHWLTEQIDAVPDGKTAEPLYLHPAPAAVPDWRPIDENTPRDKTVIWLASDARMELGLWADEDPDTKKPGWISLSNLRLAVDHPTIVVSLDFEPTFWQHVPEMPLPTSPSGGE